MGIQEAGRFQQPSKRRPSGVVVVCAYSDAYLARHVVHIHKADTYILERWKSAAGSFIADAAPGIIGYRHALPFQVPSQGLHKSLPFYCSFLLLRFIQRLPPLRSPFLRAMGSMRGSSALFGRAWYKVWRSLADAAASPRDCFSEWRRGAFCGRNFHQTGPSIQWVWVELLIIPVTPDCSSLFYIPYPFSWR